MKHEWKDEVYGTYHLENGKLFTHAFAGGAIPTSPDGCDGEALLREAIRLAEENVASGNVIRSQQETNQRMARRVRELEADVAAERERIRRELEAWLIGPLGPADAGLVGGRRIVDEIKRICKVSEDEERDA